MKLIIILFIIGLVTGWICDRNTKKQQKAWKDSTKSERK